MKFNFSKSDTFLKIMWLVALVLWCLFILSNSLASAEKSGAASSLVLDKVENTAAKLDIGFSFTEKFIRKSAHFFEYFVLGALLSVFKVFVNNHRFTLLHPLSFGLLFALFDETVQLFSPGREGAVVDVWLDFSAVFLSSLLTFIIVSYFRKKSL